MVCCTSRLAYCAQFSSNSSRSCCASYSPFICMNCTAILLLRSCTMKVDIHLIRYIKYSFSYIKTYVRTKVYKLGALPVKPPDQLFCNFIGFLLFSSVSQSLSLSLFSFINSLSLINSNHSQITLSQHLTMQLYN